MAADAVSARSNRSKETGITMRPLLEVKRLIVIASF